MSSLEFRWCRAKQTHSGPSFYLPQTGGSMRFFVSPEYISRQENLIKIIDKKEVHHIRDVLRLKEGVEVTVFDGSGNDYIGNIKHIDKSNILITISKIVSSVWRPYFNIRLYQAIPKKGKMDYIVEKVTELGINVIVPIFTERTIPDENVSIQKKIERWYRIAKASSKQCGRSDIPQILDPVDFNTAIKKAKPSDLVILAALDREARPLPDIIKNKSFKDISIFIGPEGDFSPNEVFLARQSGCEICSLGRLVLKVDTAAIFIISCINYETMNARVT